MKAILTLLVAALVATAPAVSASAADEYVPFVTDFPRPSQTEPYVPFVTDFPSGAPAVPSAGVAAPVTKGFDWLDAAFGAAGGFVLGALVAASLPVLRRDTRASTA